MLCGGEDAARFPVENHRLKRSEGFVVQRRDNSCVLGRSHNFLRSLREAEAEFPKGGGGGRLLSRCCMNKTHEHLRLLSA